MKVKITKNNDENYWYNDRIGEVFEVEETTNQLYYRANGRYKGCYIDKDDCEVIEEEPERQIINIEVWNCNTKTKFVFSTLTRITDPQQLTDVISEALNKQEDKMKEYVLNIDFVTLKKGDRVLVGPYTNVHTFENGENKIMLAIPDSCLQLALGQGIIREKKSKAEEITERIVSKLGGIPKTAQLRYEIILEVLRKAGVK